MKRTAVRLILMFLFLVTIGGQFIVETLADSPQSPYPETPDTSQPSIKIDSPNPTNIYNVQNIPYSITIEKPVSWVENFTGHLCSVGYIIDRKENFTIADADDNPVPKYIYEPNKEFFIPNPDYIDLRSENQSITLVGNLSGLTEGNHTIQFWVNSVTFYHPADTPRTFYGWWTVVAEMPVEALSDTVSFSVTNQEIETEAKPFPTTLAIATSLIIAVVCLSLFVYFKKHKRNA